MLLKTTLQIHPEQDFFKVSARFVFRIKMVIMPWHIIGLHIERGTVNELDIVMSRWQGVVFHFKGWVVCWQATP